MASGTQEPTPGQSGSGPVAGEPPASPPAQQPSWAPAAGYSQSTWAAQRGWSEPPSWPPPAPAGSRRRGCLIGCLALVGLVVVLIVAMVAAGFALLGPAMDVSNKIQQNSNGEILYVNYEWNNGVGQYWIWLAPGVTSARAQELACTVVRPALEGTKFAGTNFTIFGNDGFPAADEDTPCG